MNQDRTKRKLTAIFSADVVGYSRLMEADESWTIKTLEENKKLISEFIDEYKGRVVDAPGDNILAEFSSVTNAVECAVKIQQELKYKNANLIEDRRMEFRIGINLGEVVEEEGRIYGSGVNIAARLEGLTEAGGICISRRTYDHVKTQLDLSYEYLGEQCVKNISEPIRVYRVLMDSKTGGKVIGEKRFLGRMSRRMALATIIILFIALAGLIGWNIYSQKFDEEETPKAIAVLPFEDDSPGKDHGNIADGLSGEIINAIDQIPELKVIARTSSFSFKGQNKTIQEIASILGVDHVLEGSVSIDGNKIRIVSRLIRVADSSCLWTDTYDRPFEEIFEIQENIAHKVADKLKLTMEAFSIPGGTENIEAYEYYADAFVQYKRQEWDQARETINTALTLDSEFANAWALKAFIHNQLSNYVSSDNADSELDEALIAAQKAISLEPNLPEGYFALVNYESARGNWIDAELNCRKALSLRHGMISSAGVMAHMYRMVGYLKKSRDIMEGFVRNDPLNIVTLRSYVVTLGLLGDKKGVENENKRCEAQFGDTWKDGNYAFAYYRLGTGDPVSSDELEYSSPIFNAVKEHFDSPKEGLAKLHQLYNDESNLREVDITEVAILAAHFGDPEFAMDAMEKGIEIDTKGLFKIWFSVMKEVRQLPRFKEFMREIGLVEYWKEYGWPDLCHQLGDDDFVCE